MNSELKLRVFDIPYDVLNRINHSVVGLNGVHARGLDRAKNFWLTKR